MALRKFDHAAGRGYAFHYSDRFSGGGGRCESSTYKLPETPVSSLGCKTGSHQVAKTRQTVESLRPRAHCESQTGYFHQAARQRGSFGICTGFNAVENARSNGNNVFHCSGKFNTKKIGI